MVKKLVHCPRCNKVIPQFEPLVDFGESSILPGVEWSSEDLDEQKEFLRLHQGHALQELLIDPETFISDKPSYEPIKVAYMEASNGKERFLIRRTRTALGRPAFFEVIPGKIRVTEVSLEIQENEVRRQIAWENGSRPLSGEKVSKFIEALREELESIAPEHLNEEIETTLPGETSLLTYGSFSEARWKRVLERCEKSDFQASEIRMIEKFIQENRQPGDVLGLTIRKRVSFPE
jgi:hypothetical protein